MAKGPISDKQAQILEYIKDQILGIENGIQMSMFGSGLAALSGGGLNGLPV